jgi:hypothetical protein
LLTLCNVTAGEISLIATRLRPPYSRSARTACAASSFAYEGGARRKRLDVGGLPDYHSRSDFRPPAATRRMKRSSARTNRPSTSARSFPACEGVVPDLAVGPDVIRADQVSRIDPICSRTRRSRWFAWIRARSPPSPPWTLDEVFLVENVPLRDFFVRHLLAGDGVSHQIRRAGDIFVSDMEACGAQRLRPAARTARRAVLKR